MLLGLPDCLRPDVVIVKTNLPRNQSVDIWSLGRISTEWVRSLEFQKSGIDVYQKEQKAKGKDNKIARHSPSFTLLPHPASLELAPSPLNSTQGRKPEFAGLEVPLSEEDEVHSREDADSCTELVGPPFGQPILPNTAQYAPFLTTPPDPDEVPVTSPVNQQEDLYGLSPSRGATQSGRAPGLRLCQPTTGMGQDPPGGSSSNIHDPGHLKQLDGVLLSRPNSSPNVRAVSFCEESPSHIRPSADPI